jgi:hypothetical protein
MLSPEEAFLAAVLRSYWFPAWQVIRGKRRREEPKNIELMIEDLKSMRDLRPDFVFFCELASLDPQTIRDGVYRETGISLDEMIDALERLSEGDDFNA